jgi:hypothetical protein
MRVNPQLVTQWEETYSDHCQEGTDGTKRGLSWCDVDDVLREIYGVDGHIQRGESAIPPLRSLRTCMHGRNWRELQENGVGLGL